MKTNRGQATLIQVILGGLFASITAWGGAWISGSMAAGKELAAVNTEVQVVKNTQDLQYKEVIKALERLETKIDKIAPATVPLPKAETFQTPAERKVNKAELITNVKPSGAPQNE